MNQSLLYLNNTKFFKDMMKQYDLFEDIKFSNINEQSAALATYLLFQHTQEDIVLVTPNLYKAQKLYDALSSIAKEEEISFFPQDEFVTTEMLAMSVDFKLERINTIKKLMAKTPSIIITNTAGYIKQMVPFKKWKTALLRVKKDQELDVKQTIKTLVEFGYKREDVVENQGEFSVRGDIIDVFPFGEDSPMRIDLFDEEVETIRYFDNVTQRSTIQTTECVIYPMYEFFYSQKELEKISSIVESKLETIDFDRESRERIELDLEHLKEYNEIDQLSRYLTLLYSPESIQDYANGSTTVFFDYTKVLDNYNDIIRDISDWYDGTSDYPKMGFELVKDINRVYSKKTIYMDVFTNKELAVPININMRSKETMLYNNNVHMLLNDLKKMVGTTTVVISLTRLTKRNQLVELLDEKIPFHVIGNKDAIIPKSVNILVEENGFSIELFDSNIVFLNEDNIFKKVEHKKAKYSSLKDTKKLSTIDELKKGDHIVHYDYGIGRFLEVKTMTVGDNTNDYIHIAYKGDDSLFIPIENIHLLQKYVGSEGIKPKLNKLGSGDWAKTKQRVRKKVKDIADKLIKLYAAREKVQGFQYSEDTDLMTAFEAEFPYQETPDQLRAIADVKKDMESTMPMDRLLCGDVGYGKTEVALRAAFKAVLDNKQVAYLAPTTVLARQHYHTFKERLYKHGIKVELLNRFVTKSNQNRVIRELMSGDCHIVIGTHRLLSKDMQFADLGLLIIDEEQRFGVEHKEKIKEMKLNVDVLSLSATPIPRTLQMAIMGVKSMSLLETPPKNRYPIQTYVLERYDAVIRDSIQREMARNGQVFYLYNRVEDIEVVARNIQRLVPEARVIFAHGKMNRIELEDVLTRFIDQEYDVLVSTTIIETGIDIPNANTLLVHEADRLGLSQLYQLRGRVGRSDRIAYAYLMYDKKKQLKDEAVKRLRVIKEFTELGSGFKIALRDLSIRGAGDVLGTEQSGFMDSVGIDLYLEMLKDEIKIQSGEKEEIEETDTVNPLTLNTKINKYIDSNYIENDFIKMEMHRKIASIQSREDIKALLDEMEDRFGMPSRDIKVYMFEKYYEHLAELKGIEKVRETKNSVTLTFSEEQSNRMNGEELFMKASQVSNYIRLSYRLQKFDVIFDTLKLSKHYIYYAVDFLELI
jgi:transcription-repair coupling factor (superfamily II helicase)